MKHYIFVTEVGNEQLETIRRDFKSIFHVDLDDKKYGIYESIEEKWAAIVNDTFLKWTRKDKKFYVQKFLELLSLCLYGEQSDIVRPSAVEEMRRKKAKDELKEYTKKMPLLLNDYGIYEPDIWINAYLSIQYIKARTNQSNIDNIVDTAVPIQPPYHVRAKGNMYIIPFEEYQEGFCEQYVKKIGGKDQVQILGADVKEKEYSTCCDKVDFFGYDKRMELKLDRDMKYTRWTQKKVYSLEKSKEFKTEDKAMFHKTINGVLVRNMVDTMISTGHTYNVEDYLFLVDKLCMCKSLNWQNLIGCLYIQVSCFMRELAALDLWGDIFIMFYSWIYNEKVINRCLELLTGGLIYVAYKQNKAFDNIDEVEKKCKEELAKIEENPIPFCEETKKLIHDRWETQEKELRVTKRVEENHTQYYWIYAIMQRHVIDGLTPKKCDELRENERDWDDVVDKVSFYYEKNLENLDNADKDKLNKGTSDLPEEDKGNINVGEICVALRNRKNEESKDLKEGKITKEELLDEVKSRLIKAGTKDENGEISDAIVRKILQIYNYKKS